LQTQKDEGMNLHTSIRQWIIAASLCLCMGLPTSAIGIPFYRVMVDTSAIAGKEGYIDLQFNSKSGDPLATAVVSDFSPAVILHGLPQVDGAVSGTLPATQTFENDPSFFLNASLQPVIFGSVISFLLSFSGPFETALTGDGTAFALGILGTDRAPLLGDLDIGAALVFDLFPGVAPTLTVYDPAVSVSAIPEPSVSALIVAGLLVLTTALRGGRRYRG
jgi:hypothetical protein